MNAETVYVAPGGSASVSHTGRYTVQTGGNGPPESFSGYWDAIAAARRAAGFPVYRADNDDDRRPGR